MSRVPFSSLSPETPAAETPAPAGIAPDSSGDPQPSSLVDTGEPTFEAQLVEAEVVERVAPPAEDPTAGPSLPMRCWLRLADWGTNLVGLVSLLFSLAVLASIPVVQLFSLGYLLEASGRIASSGRLRAGFIGLKPAARLGSLVLGTGILVLPLRLVSDLWYSAYLIDPTSGVTAGWRIALVLSTTVVVGHILLAWYSGGKLRHFFWPLLAPVLFGMWFLRRLIASRLLRPIVGPVVGTISPRLLRELTTVPPLASWFPPAIFWAGLRRGGLLAEARDAVWDFFVQMRVGHYFSLGLRGYVGALIWLFVPVLLLLGSLRLPPVLGVLAGISGALSLAWVLLYLPFLQTELGVRREFRAMFDVRAVRCLFARAPLAFWFALLITLLFAVPLYLLKIEATPREVTWLESLVFVAFIYPARLLAGWAVGRARHHSQPRFFLFRWAARLAAVPVVLWYVLIVFFTQFTSWYGALSLFEQHAFLVPAPFLGL